MTAGPAGRMTRLAGRMIRPVGRTTDLVGRTTDLVGRTTKEVDAAATALGCHHPSIRRSYHRDRSRSLSQMKSGPAADHMAVVAGHIAAVGHIAVAGHVTAGHMVADRVGHCCRHHQRDS